MKYLKFLPFILLGSVLTFLLRDKIPGELFQTTKLEFFYPSSVPGALEGRLSSGMSCESIVSTTVLAFKKDRKIESEINKGTDKLSVRLEGDQLYFLTRAALEAGGTEGDAFQVVQNTDKYLTAIFIDPFGGIDTFTLNKETGKAIWSKNRSHYLVAKDVENESMMLDCF